MPREGRPVLMLWLVAAAGALTACSAPAPGEPVVAGDLRLTEALARPAPAGSTSIVFLRIENLGDEADALLGVACEIAAACELYALRSQDDMVFEESLAGLEIPPGSEINLESGHVAIRMVALRTGLSPGDRVTLVLDFELAGEVRIEAEVIAP